MVLFSCSSSDCLSEMREFSKKKIHLTGLIKIFLSEHLFPVKSRSVSSRLRRRRVILSKQLYYLGDGSGSRDVLLNVFTLSKLYCYCYCFGNFERLFSLLSQRGYNNGTASFQANYTTFHSWFSMYSRTII